MTKPKAVCAKCRKPVVAKRRNVRNYLVQRENTDVITTFELCEDCLDEFYVWLFPELSELEDADD